MTTDRLSNRLAKIEAISNPQRYVIRLNDDGSIPDISHSGRYALMPQRCKTVDEWIEGCRRSGFEAGWLP